MSSVTMQTLILALAASVMAAPTYTSNEEPTLTVPVSRTGVTHSVTAGLGGQLIFDPNNISAEKGDIVEIKWLPANHSIAQSSFAKPCEPLDNGVSIFPGFRFNTTEGLSPNVFQFSVETTEPMWFYCPQQKHCQKGMAMAINQHFDGPNTLSAYQRAAAETDMSIIPDISSIGSVELDPHPDRGFN